MVNIANTVLSAMRRYWHLGRGHGDRSANMPGLWQWPVCPGVAPTNRPDSAIPSRCAAVSHPDHEGLPPSAEHWRNRPLWVRRSEKVFQILFAIFVGMMLFDSMAHPLPFWPYNIELFTLHFKDGSTI